MSAPTEESVQEIQQPEPIKEDIKPDATAQKNVEPENKGNVEEADKIAKLENDLKLKSEECEALKTQILRLDLDLCEANMRGAHSSVEASEIQKMKLESEEMLTRAKSLIFEKTKVNKNQELQIEALAAQISSLKDVVSITKNLLEIRNVEVQHLQEQIQCMNDKVNAEKEHQNLIHQKLEQMIRMNADLKREYETQLCLFNALRERYSERELARNVLDTMRTDQNNGEPAADNSANNANNNSNPKTD